MNRTLREYFGFFRPVVDAHKTDVLLVPRIKNVAHTFYITLTNNDIYKQDYR